MELAKVEFSKCIPHELPKTASTGVDLYLLLGYPGSKNNTKNALSKKLTRTLVSYTSAKFIASPRSKSQLTDRIALQFYKKGLINSQAVKENMGKFNGNSGGPMLEVRRLVEVQGEVRFTVRLVGVFSGYDKQTHELVGCSSNALLNFIRSNGGS